MILLTSQLPTFVRQYDVRLPSCSLFTLPSFLFLAVLSFLARLLHSILLQKSIYILRGPVGGPAGSPVLLSEEVQLDLLSVSETILPSYIT